MAKDTPSQKNPPKDTTKEIGPDQTILLDFSWADLAPAYDQALKNAAKNLKMAGFRPGKVPPQIAESKVDPERLAQKTLQKLLPPAYEAQLTAAKLTPIIQPEFILIKADKDQDWQVEAHFAVKPEIKLGDYQQILQQAKTTALKEITATEKTKADQAKKTTTAAQESLTKKPTGTKADVIELDPALQPLTPEQIESQALDRAILALRDTIKPVMPEILVKKQAQQQLQELLDQLKQFNLELDAYLHNTGNTFEQLADQVTQDALRKLQLDFIMQSLMDAEKITATPAEIHAEFDQIFSEHTAPQHHHDGDDHDHDGDDHHDHAATAKLQAEREADPYYQAYVTDLIRRRKLVEFLKKLK